MSFEQHGQPKPLQEKYRKKADENGYVFIGEWATQELNRQSKNIATFFDGEEGTNPEINFGDGIRFKGTSGNYDIRIHIDDLDEFVRRVKNYYSEV